MELREQLQDALSDAYTLERELGGAGMSRVFLATERALDRKVVVKVLSPDLAAGLSAERFAREIRFAASLQQANVVPVLTTGEADGLPFYTMPYVTGLSLRERLERDGRLDIVAAIGILRDIARALAYAHTSGVVHRDIKPENVLLSGEAAVVTDFGIAKAISAARGDEEPGAIRTTFTQAGMVIGTPAYMSPEQITADPHIDHRADLYSFGCLAYEVLAGTPPFVSKKVHELFAQHMQRQPTPLSQLRPDCPLALARVVTQCLEKSADQRPGSAHDILRALDGTTVPVAGIRRLVNRLTRRQRLVAGAAATLLVASAVVLPARSVMRARRDAGDDVSLAILPFLNVGGDSTRNLWADGLTDQVTTAMSRVPRVRLATRLSVDRFRGGRNIDPRVAGRTLQVRHVLQGTLWPQGDQVMVVVWLSNTADATEEWRDSFRRDARDILTTLDSVTSSITASVQRRVAPASTPVSIAAQSLRGTSDTAAYEMYLRGEALLRSRGNVPRAAQLFTQAIARDSTFARAYAGLSAALVILPNFADSGYVAMSNQAAAVARHALALDSTLSEARTSLAVSAMSTFRWAEAEAEFRRGLASDPADPYLHMHYARYLIYTGRLADGIAELQRAKRLDPTSAVIGGWLAHMLQLAGRTSEAYAEIDRALELDSTSVPIAYMGAEVALARGQRARARTLAEVIWRPNGVTRQAPWPSTAASVFMRLGDRHTAETIFEETARSPANAFRHSALLIAALALGDTARALDELERAQEAHEFWPSAPILIDPSVDVLRRSKRFAAAVALARLDVALFTSPTAGRPK